MPQSLALSRAGSISLRLRCLKPARSSSQAKSLSKSLRHVPFRGGQRQQASGVVVRVERQIRLFQLVQSAMIFQVIEGRDPLAQETERLRLSCRQGEIGAEKIHQLAAGQRNEVFGDG